MAKCIISIQLDLFETSLDDSCTNNQCADCIFRFWRKGLLICAVHGKRTESCNSCIFFEPSVQPLNLSIVLNPNLT